MRVRYFDILGRELAGVEEWGRLFEDWHYRCIGQTHIGDVMVSTVWLGIDMYDGFCFETMIFGGSLDQDAFRYRTHGEACAGHDAAVAMVRSEAEL